MKWPVQNSLVREGYPKVVLEIVSDNLSRLFALNLQSSEILSVIVDSR